jgi:hypothetical protein
MGFDLNAFLGRTSDLQAWKQQLPSAVVCELSGDLGMVPATDRLYQELRARLGADDANRLDAARGVSTWPSASGEAGAQRWALEASRGTTVAYVSVGEFGDQSYDHATVWTDGREVLSGVVLRTVLDYLRDTAGLQHTTRPDDLEQQRGDDAAERWAKAAQARGRG